MNFYLLDTGIPEEFAKHCTGVAGRADEARQHWGWAKQRRRRKLLV